MEYLGGDDLYKRICQTGALSGISRPPFRDVEWESARIIRHIARGLEALHEKQILHLDVKLENVIFESKEPNSLMKLADFGCCYVQDVEECPPDEIIGTAGYIAPEIISVGRRMDEAWLTRRTCSIPQRAMCIRSAFSCTSCSSAILPTKATTRATFYSSLCIAIDRRSVLETARSISPPKNGAPSAPARRISCDACSKRTPQSESRYAKSWKASGSSRLRVVACSCRSAPRNPCRLCR